MKELNWFDQSPKGDWLSKPGNKVRVGEVVWVGGRSYRYTLERDGQDCVLSPVEARKS